MTHDVKAGFDEETYRALLLTPRVAWEDGYMPFAYICSPFAGDEVENMARARVYARFAFEMGYIPFCGHIYFPQFCFEETEREKVMRMNNVFLGKCHEVWVFGDEITAGMKAEIERATRKPKVKVRYFTKDLKERK